MSTNISESLSEGFPLLGRYDLVTCVETRDRFIPTENDLQYSSCTLIGFYYSTHFGIGFLAVTIFHTLNFRTVVLGRLIILTLGFPRLNSFLMIRLFNHLKIGPLLVSYFPHFTPLTSTHPLCNHYHQTSPKSFEAPYPHGIHNNASLSFHQKNTCVVHVA